MAFLGRLEADGPRFLRFTGGAFELKQLDGVFLGWVASDQAHIHVAAPAAGTGQHIRRRLDAFRTGLAHVPVS
jgi:hypothetical protein